MDTRLLPSDEWHRLESIYADRDCPLPEVGSAFVLVLEDKGKIVGSWAFHGLTFGGLMYVDESHRNNGVGARLAKAATELFTNLGGSVFTVIDSEASQHMAEQFGMKEVSGRLFRADF